MKAAGWPRGARGTEMLMRVGEGERQIFSLSALPSLLEPGDVLVVNDAATIPASLAVSHPDGTRGEVRLLSWRGGTSWTGVLFGPGSWRQRTEDRPVPPRIAAGARLLADGATLRVDRVLPRSARLLELTFELEPAAQWDLLFHRGRPIQYSHLVAPLPLWHVQNVYAARPWAVEQPSAGRALTGSAVLELMRRGVRLVALTHATGLSATGDPAIDAALPFPERYEVPAETVAAVSGARAEGRRVIAVGTSVVRALEGNALERGGLRAGGGVTGLRIGPGFVPQLCDGLLTGLHEPTASHFALLQAFLPRAALEAAYAEAEAKGFLAHEFGDWMWLERRR